jgi:hypothetical protein
MADYSDLKLEFHPQKIYSSMLRAMNPQIISSVSKFSIIEKERKPLKNLEEKYNIILY